MLISFPIDFQIYRNMSMVDKTRRCRSTDLRVCTNVKKPKFFIEMYCCKIRGIEENFSSVMKQNFCE